MSCLYKRGDSPYWWAKITHRGKTVECFSTGARTRRDAKKIMQAAHTRWAETRRLTAKANMPVYAARYIEWGRNTKKWADRTCDTYICYFKNHICPYFGEGLIDEITTVQLNDFITYLEGKNLKDKTCNNIMVCLSGMFRQAKRERYIINNPMDHVKFPSYDRKPKGRALSVEEAHQLLDELMPPPPPSVSRLVARPTPGRVVMTCCICGKEVERFQSEVRGGRVVCSAKRCISSISRQAGLKNAQDAYEFFLVLVNTGCRSGELKQLKWDQVKLAAGEETPETGLSGGDQVRYHGEITILKHTSKSRKERPIPLTPRAAEALHERLARGPRDDGLVFGDVAHYNALKGATERADLGKLRPHDMRYSYASILLASGATPAEVRDLLGHADLRMVSYYTHTTPENLRRAVSRLKL